MSPKRSNVSVSISSDEESGSNTPEMSAGKKAFFWGAVSIIVTFVTVFSLTVTGVLKK
jgi:hypothetical protein